MKKKEYETFKKMWVEKFKLYYKYKTIERKDLKRNIFDNPKLNDKQKEEFWELIGGKNVKSSNCSRETS